MDRPGSSFSPLGRIKASRTKEHIVHAPTVNEHNEKVNSPPKETVEKEKGCIWI